MAWKLKLLMSDDSVVTGTSAAVDADTGIVTFEADTGTQTLSPGDVIGVFVEPWFPPAEPPILLPGV